MGNDLFKDSLKTICKVRNISSAKKRFMENGNVITIVLKNDSDQGLDSHCFELLNYIFSLAGPKKVKFNFSTILFPDSQKIDRIQISFERHEYELLNEIFM